MNGDADILKNCLGIKDKDMLEKSESSFSFLRMQEMKDSPIHGKFDLIHMKEIHKRLFSDVYEWAGQIRQVDGSEPLPSHNQASASRRARRTLTIILIKAEI